jgi:hypothetical protein
LTAAPRNRLRSRLQAVVHGLVIVAGWVVFAWFWWRVFGQPWDSADLRRLVIGAAVGFPLVTGVWIIHNIGIYKRRGPRRAVPPAPLRYDTDFNGRRIDSDWSALAQAAVVTIALDDGVKRFRALIPPGPG